MSSTVVADGQGALAWCTVADGHVVVRAAEARYRGDNRRCPGRKHFGDRPVPATTAQLIQAHPPLDRRQAVHGGELQDAVPGDALQDGAQTRGDELDAPG